MYTLAGHYTQQAEWAEGIAAIRRMLALEPWREEAHRQLMLLLAHDGQRSAALAQFETFRQILEEELGVEPSEETKKVYERIRDEDPVRDQVPTSGSEVLVRSARSALVTKLLKSSAASYQSFAVCLGYWALGSGLG